MYYKEFKEYVVSNVKDYLPEEYQDYTIEIRDINKSGLIYEGLVISPIEKDMVPIPVINLEKSFASYRDGAELDEIMTEIADIRTSNSISQKKISNIFNKFDPNKIYARLINTEMNKEYLKDKPSIEVADLSMVFTVRVDEDETGFAESVISDALSEMWEVDKLELSLAAMQNIADAPYKFMTIAEALGMPGIDELFPVPMYILTNRQKTKGAYEVMNANAMTAIRDKIGDFYIIPSSVEEVIIVPQEGNDPDCLRKMVKDINPTLEDTLYLSDNIYEYDFDNYTLRIVDD